MPLESRQAAADGPRMPGNPAATIDRDERSLETALAATFSWTAE
jgi:hypothetical protein